MQIGSGTVSAASNMTINLPVIPMTGAYLVAFASGTYTVQLTAGLEVNATINPDGTPLGISTTTPAESKRFIFTGTAGQNLGLALTNIVFNPTSGYAANLSVYNPDGSLLVSSGSCYKDTIYNGCGVNLSLAQTGTYSVVVKPPSGPVTMSFTATLSQDTPGIGTLLSPNVPYPLNIQYSGQQGLMSFNASAGQTVALEVSGITTNPVNELVDLYVYAPGGWPHGNPIASVATTTGYTFNLPNLPAGTYTVYILPNFAATASMTVTLVPGVTGVLTPDGSGSQFSTTAPGQNVYMTFTGTAGQNLGTGAHQYRVQPDVGICCQPFCIQPGRQLTGEQW